MYVVFTQRKQKVVALIFLSIIIVLSVTIRTVIYLSSKPRASQNNSQQVNETGDCLAPIEFIHHFTDPATIISIIPPVFKNSKGLMPTTLINIRVEAPLYMPTSGRIKQGSYHNEQGAQFYMWEVDVGCGITVVFDHVTEPIEKIRALFPDIPRNDSRTDFFETQIEMDAGELVGYTAGSVNAHNWNFAVYDASEKNYLWGTEEFKNQPKYYTQVCPFKFYDNQMAQAYEKLLTFSFNDISVEKNLCGE